MLETEGTGVNETAYDGGVPDRSRAAPIPALRKAVGHALAGDWEAAHTIVQEFEEDATAAWIHAVAHRMEGDLANARYWYRRCHRDLREDVSSQDELREIEKALGA
jgi:phosphodiesterase/alkaline phosphatase D-like protein